MISFSESKKNLSSEEKQKRPPRNWVGVRPIIRLLIDDRGMAWWDRQGSSLLTELKRAHPHFQVSVDKVSLQVRWHQAQSTRSRPVYRADDLLDCISPRTTDDFATVLLTPKIMTSLKHLRVQVTVVEGKARSSAGVAVVCLGDTSNVLQTLLHELGHLFGLPHCEISSCLMAVEHGGSTCCPSCERQITQRSERLVTSNN